MQDRFGKLDRFIVKNIFQSAKKGSALQNSARNKILYVTDT